MKAAKHTVCDTSIAINSTEIGPLVQNPGSQEDHAPLTHDEPLSDPSLGPLATYAIKLST